MSDRNLTLQGVKIDVLEKKIKLSLIESCQTDQTSHYHHYNQNKLGLKFNIENIHDRVKNRPG